MDQEQARFRFTVCKVVKNGEDGYAITVHVKITDPSKKIHFDGPVIVEMNTIGIFPRPSDIAKATPYKGIRGKLGAEIKRYIKIQKKFIPELAEDDYSL
ncbi:hypothetical protein [Jeotgalibacillus sp. R-1-5s-1]|uniref:hypothetical protein n=1 Tax=Jeotgalibacillus sp. R-1-5s-1 TaxID=2555897 RepID=UPI001069A80C|nr:hypothetical protein [Jeotgalibacillus sp. R-1-5s-1]TFE03305.1 hypothetical protein E2491_00520 [Jeotgalibacillus sp. R-1-5s-1]